MMRSSLFGLVTMLAAGLAAPAMGQLAPSRSGFSDAPTTADETEYWLMMGEMGACMASRKRAEAEAFVAQVIDSPQEDAAFGKLFHRDSNPCLGNFVRASMIRAQVRGVVAEGLFEDLDQAAFAASSASMPAPPDTVVTLHDFARCYVIVHPQEAAALLRKTRVATKDEMAMFRQMAGQFGPCLPEGVTINLKPTTVRFALAEALYRVATGAPAPTIASRN